MAATACFARKVALWFEHKGLERVADPVRLRQMNMAIALAASRWRAVVRGADARAEAIRLARGWFADCVRSESTE
jgi:hypothetical protein